MPVLATVLIGTAASSANVPRRFNYQARLVGPAYGDAVVDLQVKLWDDPVGGTELFSELHYDVSLQNGIFSIPVGAAAGSIPDTALDASQVWLELAADTDQDGTMDDTFPRTRLLSVPFAIKAISGEQLVLPGTFDPVVTVGLTADVDVGSTIRLRSVNGNIQTVDGVAVVDVLDGAALARLYENGGVGRLALDDASGNTVVDLWASGDGNGQGSLRVRKPDGTDAVALLAGDEDNLGGMLEVYGSAGDTTFQVQGGQAGGGTTVPEMLLRNGDLASQSQLLFGAQWTGSSLTMTHEDGTDTVQVRAAASSGTGPVIKLNNLSGNTSVEIDGDTGGSGDGLIAVRNAAGQGMISLHGAGDDHGQGKLSVKQSDGTVAVALSSTDDNDLGGMVEVFGAGGGSSVQVLGGDTSGGTTPVLSVMYPAPGSAGEAKLNAAYSGGRITATHQDSTETVQILAAQSTDSGPVIRLNNLLGNTPVELNGDIDGSGNGLIRVQNASGQGAIALHSTGDDHGEGRLSVRQSDGTLAVALSATDHNDVGGMLEVLSESGATAFEVLGGSPDAGTRPELALQYPAPSSAAEVRINAQYSGGRITATNEDGTETVQILAANTSGAGPRIFMQDTSGDTVITLDGSLGRVRAKIVEITGADLAEKFPTSEKVKPGMVVAIDPENPGQLCLARGAYNRCVAGIVSGANDFAAGAILGDLPGHEDAPPIALSGRVWCRCDASYGAIRPGDLLTTSTTPGHAMKVTDHSKAQGAIIGKAMTGLESDRGLVLVLVALQ
jgi:hypothetical protein